MDITSIAQSINKGVYLSPGYFLDANGSVTDKNGRTVQPPNDALKAAREAILNAVQLTPGPEDTVQVRVALDGRMFVPAYPPYPILNQFCIPLHEVSETAPHLFEDGDLWVKENTEAANELFVRDGDEWAAVERFVDSDTEPVLLVEGSFWASSTSLKELTEGVWEDVDNYTVSDTQPDTPKAGDYWYDTVNEELKVYADSSFTEVTETYVYSETEPIIHEDGYYWWDSGNELLKVLATTWGTVEDYYVLSATPPYIYSDGDRYGNSTDGKVYILDDGAFAEEEGKPGHFYYTAEKVYRYDTGDGIVEL